MTRRNWSWSVRTNEGRLWFYVCVYGPPCHPGQWWYWLRRFVFGGPITIVGGPRLFLSWDGLLSLAFGLRGRDERGWAFDFGPLALVRRCA